MADETYLTKDGYEKIRKELFRLKTVRRPEIAKMIEEAREQGDLSENSGYDAAKEAQAFNEKRISDLENKITKARIIEEGIVRDEVCVGARVTLLDMESNDEEHYLLVSAAEADFKAGKISVSSPVGAGLLGHKKDATIEITTPGGKIRYRILGIS